MSTWQTMRFHVHVNNDLPWLNTLINTLVSLHCYWYCYKWVLAIMSCLWGSPKRQRLVFFFLCNRQVWTLCAISFTRRSAPKWLFEMMGRCVLCVGVYVLWVVKFLEQTLPAALHSNQITRQGVQRTHGLWGPVNFLVGRVCVLMNYNERTGFSVCKLRSTQCHS